MLFNNVQHDNKKTTWGPDKATRREDQMKKTTKTSRGGRRSDKPEVQSTSPRPLLDARRAGS
ncbi:hypothetical protein EON65_29975 [archaeon]|nr:MAG: hypothetical protein EON65_29975 [archaeon]